MSLRTKHLALLQKIFRYAAPLLVAVESIDQLNVPDKARDILQASLWWNLLLTTRVLIAHATILVDANPRMCSTIGTNLGALLRLVCVDIATKDAFETTRSSNTVWYKMKQGKRLWLPFKRGVDAVLDDLTSSSFEVVQADFTGMMDRAEDEETRFDLQRIQQLFGYAVYQLVATSDNEWRRLAAQYSAAPVLG